MVSMMADSALTLVVVGMAVVIVMLSAVLLTVLRLSGQLRAVWQQGRALGGFVYQEEQKTRSLIRELGGRL